jgi:hypothetical protein
MLVPCVQDHWQCVKNIKLDQDVSIEWCSDVDLANGYSICIGPILQFILKHCCRTVVFLILSCNADFFGSSSFFFLKLHSNL